MVVVTDEITALPPSIAGVNLQDCRMVRRADCAKAGCVALSTSTAVAFPVSAIRILTLTVPVSLLRKSSLG